MIWRKLGRAAVLLVLTSCSTLTPQQTTALKEAQRIADQVTTAYGVARIRVFASDLLPRGVAAGHSHRHDWILISPAMLIKDEFDVVVTHELGHATLGHRSIPNPSGMELFTLRRNELEANRRGVEIMVRFLGITQREAVDRYAAYRLEEARARRGKALPLRATHFHPCIELRDLWRSFAVSESLPACEEK